jgi:hypothetical protein
MAPKPNQKTVWSSNLKMTFNITDETTNQKGCLSKIQRLEWSSSTKVTSDLTPEKKLEMCP